jgi:hypothetical protein
MIKPLVYISSPYSKGSISKNVRFQHHIWEQLRRRNTVTPIAPLWSHYQDVHFPLTHAEWLDYDLEVIRRCDAVLRLDAGGPGLYHQHESSGADMEVKFATELGIPVFYSVGDLYEWADAR